jgi:hypothetical protein
MGSLFDGLNDLDSFEIYYNFDLKAFCDAWEDSSKEGNYPQDSEEEDPFNGLDEEDLKLAWNDLPLSTFTSFISSLTSSFTSLLLYYP